MSFLPWTNNFTKGYHLADVEIIGEKEAPAGWKKWILPARKFLVAEVPEGKYGEIFSFVIFFIHFILHCNFFLTLHYSDAILNT